MTAPTIGLAEAARICRVSESTLRRKRAELVELGASHGPKGWSIPIPALVELGLLDATTGPDTVVAPAALPDSPVEPITTPAATAELEALREALTAAELRAAVAEAVAAERERIIEAQAQALRMLEAPAAAPPAPPEAARTVEQVDSPAAAPEAAAAAPRRSWWPFRLSLTSDGK
jgi:hypothetical protein